MAVTPRHPDYATWPVPDQIRYCLAREIWPYRDEQAPNREKIGGVTRHCSWAEVFQLRYAESLDAYADRMMKEQQRAA